MNRLSIRIVGASLLMLGLTACSSQESEFVDFMTKEDPSESRVEAAHCAYAKLVETQGEEFIAEFLDSAENGIPTGFLTVGGAIMQCVVVPSS